MKKRTDMDGNRQVDFFSAATIDVMKTPSLPKFIARFNEVQRLIESGDADYGRLVGQSVRWKAISEMKHYKWAWHDGERVSVVEAKGITRFLESWLSRKAWYVEELKSLQRSIDFYKSQEGEFE